MKDDIAEAAKRIGCPFDELSEAAVLSLFDAIAQQFAVAGGGPLWGRFRNAESVHDPRSWRLVGDLIGATPNILLVQDAQGVCGYRFANGKTTESVLAECPAFEFYVTDDTVTYALCFNHHDVLIGAGKAAEWINSMTSGGDAE